MIKYHHQSSPNFTFWKFLEHSALVICLTAVCLHFHRSYPFGWISRWTERSGTWTLGHFSPSASYDCGFFRNFILFLLVYCIFWKWLRYLYLSYHQILEDPCMCTILPNILSTSDGSNTILWNIERTRTSN